MRKCTESGCGRGAVVTIINPQTGSGGHLCQEHAMLWAAGFLMQSVSAHVQARHERAPIRVVRGRIKEAGTNG